LNCYDCLMIESCFYTNDSKFGFVFWHEYLFTLPITKSVPTYGHFRWWKIKLNIFIKNVTISYLIIQLFDNWPPNKCNTILNYWNSCLLLSRLMSKYSVGNRRISHHTCHRLHKLKNNIIYCIPVSPRIINRWKSGGIKNNCYICDIVQMLLHKSKIHKKNGWNKYTLQIRFGVFFP
jgi:hypothetical protein